MKSRITIELDYDNSNQPVIQILSRNSEDIRDGLIKAFYQKLGGSSWCRIQWRQHEINPIYPELDFGRIFITPIPDADLKEQAEIMLEQDRINKGYSNNTLTS